MSDRLPARVRIDAFRRLVEGQGGNVAIVARGDDDAGDILLLSLDRAGRATGWERGWRADGTRGPMPAGTPDQDPEAVAAYVVRRRRSDPDLWVVEAIVAHAERFGAETLWTD